MRTPLAFVVGSIALAVATPSYSQDKATAPSTREGLVVTARLHGAGFSPNDGFVTLSARTDDAERRTLTSRLTVTPDGEMRAVIDGERLDVPGILELSGSGRNRKGGLVVYRKSLRGEVDLGDVAFGDEAPVLVAGRAVTPRKRPIGGNSWIRVRIERPSGGSFVLEEMRAQTQDDGRFVVYGDARGVEGLVVETTGCWKTAKPPKFVVGAKDVEVVADSAVGVRGRLQVPAGLPLTDLVLEFLGPPQGTVDASVDAPTSVHHRDPDCLEFPASESFSITGVQPGQYDLRVKFRGAHRVLARVADVKVDDETTFLPTLSVIEPICRITIHVASADGSPAKDAKLWVRDKGDRGSYREAKLDGKSSAEVVYVGEAAELAARAAGADFVLATASKDVTLTPAATQATNVSVTLPKGAPKSSKDSDLHVAFTWRGAPDLARAAVDAAFEDTDPRGAETIEVGFPETGPAFAAISVPGWYRVQLRARRTTGRSEGWCGRELGLFRMVGGTTVNIPIELSSEEIDSLLNWNFRPGAR